MNLLIHIIVCCFIGAITADTLIGWVYNGNFNITGAIVNILFVIISTILANSDFYSKSIETIKNFFKVSSMIFLLSFMIGCAKDPKVIKERQIEKAYNEQMLPCVILKVAIDYKGYVRETYYKCIENDVIYLLRGGLGNEGDTVKVMRQRMYNRQN